MTIPQTLLAADNAYDYPLPVWQHFRTASAAGRFDAADTAVVSGRAGTPAASSVLELQFKFADGRVSDARFRAYGCPVSIAVGCWLAEWAIGKNAQELSTLKAAELRLALEIPDEKAHCALMGEDAVHTLLQALLKAAPREPS